MLPGVTSTASIATPAEAHPADALPADADEAPPNCSIAAALNIVGDRWTILILRDAFRGIRRFDEFQRDLDIARPVLAERLKRLVAAGLMHKHEYQSQPVRYEYRLTRMGFELSPALVALMRWGDAWLADGSPPTVLVHEPCGRELAQGFWCPTCKQTFSPSEISSRPGRAGHHESHAHA
jgi:DNA-binding HxlR family transcriptional regulator